ncbi:SpdD-like protein [Streptomyces sp. NBC_00536]|uniref:SpdD-like protein n=1 Tax=Streptomyces sp. NBC_00536 TaxID=2975769 RepID=UPI002E81312E|nr:SpdD-like protein [Streptomyces sp. NBC_00536]WUC81297.1 SpdD-like protein [Streptomyces sp. NBC_00536]
MLRPRIPVNPLPPGITTPTVQPFPLPGAGSLHKPAAPTVPVHHSPIDIAPSGWAPVTPAPAPAHPTVQLTPGSTAALVAGGVAVVLVVGAVLVSMLLAVAITGVSVALVAVVLRLLVKDLQKGR